MNQYYVINPDAGRTDASEVGTPDVNTRPDSQTVRDSATQQDSGTPAVDAACGFTPGRMPACGETVRITLINHRIETVGQYGFQLNDIQTGPVDRALMDRLDPSCNVLGHPAVRQGESREYYVGGSESLTIRGDQVQGGYTYGIMLATLDIRRNCGVSAPSTGVDAGAGCRPIASGWLNQGEALVLSGLPAGLPDRLQLDDLRVRDGNASAIFTLNNSGTGRVSDGFGQDENMTQRRRLNDQHDLAVTTGDVQAGYSFGVKRAEVAASLCPAQRDAGRD